VFRFPYLFYHYFYSQMLSSLDFLLMVLEFELSATPNTGFALVTFGIRSNLDFESPIYASHIARLAGMCYYAQLLLVEMGSHKLFAQVSCEPRFS
jgi:hypothetical protein